MIRVLFVQGAGHRAGAEGVLLGLVRHLPDHGVRPMVAFLADGPFVDEVEDAGAHVVRCPSSARAHEVWKFRGVARALASVARETEADIVHANGEKMAIFAGRAARRAGVPSVVRLHDAPFDDASSFAVQLMMRLSPHDEVVTGSNWMADAFLRRWRIHARTIHNGIDLDRLPTQPADVLGIAGWPPDSVVVGFFGRLQQWKGIEVFLRAAALVARDDPKVRALVVGGALYGREEGYASELRELASELGVAERVHFTGHRDDALALMAACDVVVHASLRPEPLGMVVPEAMALGRAVVASRSRGPEEVIDDGVTGMLVPPGDERALATTVAALVSNPDERERLGIAGRKAVAAYWSADRMASEFADLYRTLKPSSR
jgi:glycosyltransferase involved in cell wall biosynthesis